MNKLFYYISTLKRAILKCDYFEACMIKCNCISASKHSTKYSNLFEQLVFVETIEDLYAIEKIALQKLAKA